MDEEDWRRATTIAVDGHRIGGVSDLASPLYPSGTPTHIAFYLSVDDVDRRADAATANGARLVVPPFDAGDQGRIATLIDPVGAASSLWQPHRLAGWGFPPRLAGAPHRMVLACDQPDRARRFYQDTTGSPLICADFIGADASGPVVSTPQWELSVGVDDLESVVGRARGHGRGLVNRSAEAGRFLVRLSSPEGLTVQVRRLD
ncbi:VOC family protein [Streptomyces sp. NPDC002838]|uniref:VOC family protein n=1 Tax=Streptomyces sp. NPDC002838 TaxID=3154436 RepID=UPI00331EA7C2